MFSINRIVCITIALVLASINQILAQDTIGIAVLQDTIITQTKENAYKLNYKHLVAPALFIGYGIVSLESDGLKQLNFSTREEINEHQPDHIRLDNYSQYAPALLVYSLNIAGINGRHNFRDRSIIYATSQLISAAFVVPLKHIMKVERPDGSNRLSFPSGHTATAFSSAQFMFREYKDTNFWLSISGYSFAIFTGVYRTLNDRHWLNDVIPGAGFGILSTELSYWIYPKIDKLLSKKEKKSATMVMPFYQNKGFGIGLIEKF